MAQLKKIRVAEFDTIVIGGGLSGLITATLLEDSGRKVALVEALDTLGGNCRPSISPVGPVDHGLKFFANTAKSEALLNWLEGVLQKPLPRTLVDAAPVTYDNGRFQPFVGFGEQGAEAVSEIGYYTQAQYWRLGNTPKDWIAQLSEGFTGELYLQSHVTKIQVEDEFVLEIIVNGAKRITAREYVFCAPPQQLLRLLPEASIPPRLRQKLAKGSVFTSIHLDLLHSTEVTNSEAVHVLRGANEEPCWGLFQPMQTDAEGKSYQASQWVTLVPNDQTDDDELVATALKKIKRQIKRAYPEALDHLLHERILVCPGSHGDLAGALSEQQTLPKLQNLWISSSYFSGEKNLMGTLEQCQLAIGHLGVNAASSELLADEDDSNPSPTLL